MSVSAFRMAGCLALFVAASACVTDNSGGNGGRNPEGVPPDCEPADPNIGPTVDEVCDGRDNDCDGLVDDEDPNVVGQLEYYRDRDGDLHGDPQDFVLACVRPPDRVVDNQDCDDNSSEVNPLVEEICNGIDDDCDGLVDDDDPDVQGRASWHPDDDGDGYGQPASVEACVAPADHVADGTDCDDADENTYPDALESADDKDNDCDGQIDENFSVSSLVLSDYGDLEPTLVAGDADFAGHGPDFELVVEVNNRASSVDLTISATWSASDPSDATEAVYTNTFGDVYETSIGCFVAELRDARGGVDTYTLTETLTFTGSDGWGATNVYGETIVESANIWGNAPDGPNESADDVGNWAKINLQQFETLEILVYCPDWA